MGDMQTDQDTFEIHLVVRSDGHVEGISIHTDPDRTLLINNHFELALALYPLPPPPRNPFNVWPNASDAEDICENYIMEMSPDVQQVCRLIVDSHSCSSKACLFQTNVMMYYVSMFIATNVVVNMGNAALDTSDVCEYADIVRNIIYETNAIPTTESAYGTIQRFIDLHLDPFEYCDEHDVHPFKSITRSCWHGDPSICIICQSHIVDGEYFDHLPCSHIFHASCDIQKWLLNSNMSCPLCRTPVV